MYIAKFSKTPTLKNICERLLLDLDSENPLNFDYLFQIFFYIPYHGYTLSASSKSCATFFNFSYVHKGVPKYVTVSHQKPLSKVISLNASIAMFGTSSPAIFEEVFQKILRTY